MKKLDVMQMENLQGGKMTWGCAGAILGTGLAIAGLATATGGAGLVIAAISMSTAPMSLVACG